MRKSTFTEEQIIAILREQETGVATAEVCGRSGPGRRKDGRAVSGAAPGEGERGSSVAIGRTQRKVRTIGTRLIDGAREGRPRQQARAIVPQSCEVGSDLVNPIGVEERWRGGAIGHREGLARRPGSPGQVL